MPFIDVDGKETWLPADTIGEAEGLFFLCPVCFVTNGNTNVTGILASASATSVGRAFLRGMPFYCIWCGGKGCFWCNGTGNRL